MPRVITTSRVHDLHNGGSVFNYTALLTTNILDGHNNAYILQDQMIDLNDPECLLQEQPHLINGKSKREIPLRFVQYPAFRNVYYIILGTSRVDWCCSVK